MNNKFIAMVILNPNIQTNQIDLIQSNITTLFEQYCKIQKVWHLGKRKLDYKIKKYTEGYYLKLEILAKDKKIDNIKSILKNNKHIIFSLIMKDEDNKNNLPIIKKATMPFTKHSQIDNININVGNRNVYMLISKNMKLPFSESNILAISDDENRIFKYANKEIQKYIYVKGYKAISKFRTIKDLENELKRKCKVTFVLGQNSNIGQELLVQKQSLI